MLIEAPVGDEYQGKLYYHGTPKEESGLGILRQGIKPGQTKEVNALTPVKGKVYITPDLELAVTYILGGYLMGKEIPDQIQRNGRYGFLFVVRGDDLRDVQPDEDSVGEMVSKGKVDWLNDMARESLINEFPIEKDDLGRDLFDMVMDGEYSAWAEAGKILVDEMTDQQKLELISLGAHIAHEGVIKPFQAWKFDKTLTPKLDEKASNFFILANRVL